MSSGQNTPYRVELTAGASLDLEDIYLYIGAASSTAARNWYNSLELLIDSLDHLPERGAYVAEDANLRQLFHGNKPHIYRIIYRTDHTARSVQVLHIRHGARQPFTTEDLR